MTVSRYSGLRSFSEMRNETKYEAVVVGAGKPALSYRYYLFFQDGNKLQGSLSVLGGAGGSER